MGLTLISAALYPLLSEKFNIFTLFVCRPLSLCPSFMLARIYVYSSRNIIPLSRPFADFFFKILTINQHTLIHSKMSNKKQSDKLTKKILMRARVRNSRGFPVLSETIEAFVSLQTIKLQYVRCVCLLATGGMC